MGPKRENVRFSFVLPLLCLKCQRSPEYPRIAKGRSRDTARNQKKKEIFQLKMLRADLQKIASCPGGGAHFHKNHECMSPKNEKCCLNHVRYIKILPIWGRIHDGGIKIMSDTSLKSPKEATCSNNTHI